MIIIGVIVVVLIIIGGIVVIVYIRTRARFARLCCIHKWVEKWQLSMHCHSKLPRPSRQSL